PRGQYTVLGDVRVPLHPPPGLPRNRAAGGGPGTRFGGAVLHLRLGALRGDERPDPRYEDLRRVRAPEGTPGEVRILRRSRRRGGEGAAGAMNALQVSVLRSLARQYPTVDAAAAEIARLEGLLELPKGVTHVISDIHGDDRKLQHVLNNASG